MILGPGRSASRRGRAAVLIAVAAAMATLGTSSCAGPGDDHSEAAAIAVEATPPSTEAPEVSPAPPSGQPSDRPSVAIVGDSITREGERVLRSQLGDRWELRIDGKSGYTIADQQPAAVALAKAGPTQIIVNLGTNDVLLRHSTATLITDLKQLLSEIDAVGCIHVVNIAEGMVRRGNFTAAAMEANTAIAGLVASSEGVTLVDWANEVRRGEAEPDPEGPMLIDTVHPSETGQRRLAALYAEALGSCGP